MNYPIPSPEKFTSPGYILVPQYHGAIISVETEREPMNINMMVGARRVGRQRTVEQMISEAQSSGRRVLIFDVNDEYELAPVRMYGESPEDYFKRKIEYFTRRHNQRR